MHCFLHIGLPKTGTSHLQKSLSESYAPLRDRGVLYPEAGRRFGKSLHDRHIGLRFACQPLDRDPNGMMTQVGLASRPSREKYKVSFWGDLKKEIGKAGDIETVILSDEALSVFTNQPMVAAATSELSRMFSTLSIVAFFRRPSDYLASAYSQSIKMGKPGRWEAFFEKNIAKAEKKGIFEGRLINWRNFSEHDRFLVGASRGDIVEQFASVIGMTFVPKATQSRVNSALSPVGLRVLRRINELCGDASERPEGLRKSFERFATGAKWTPPPEDVDRINEVFEPEIRRIAKTFDVAPDDRHAIDGWFSEGGQRPDERGSHLSESEIDELAQIILETARR